MMGGMENTFYDFYGIGNNNKRAICMERTINPLGQRKEETGNDKN